MKPVIPFFIFLNLMAASASSPYKYDTQAVSVAYRQGRVDQDPAGEMLSRAVELQQHVNAGNTAYRHKTDDVAWGDNNGDYHCYTDCSGFINALISKTCHWGGERFQESFWQEKDAGI